MTTEEAIEDIKKDMAHRPTFEHELALKGEGYSSIAGADEVGIGCIYGPVVAAAVIIPADKVYLFEGLVRDSKKMTPKRRLEVYPLIKEHCVYSIQEVDNNIIDSINIRNANKLALTNAINNVPADYALVDGNLVLKNVNIPYKSIIKGDDKALSISCASVLAKVYRDALVCVQGLEFSVYKLHKNKGYGTAEHILAIKEHGICKYHRKSFGKVKEYV